jgi:hypothetical protein
MIIHSSNRTYSYALPAIATIRQRYPLRHSIALRVANAYAGIDDPTALAGAKGYHWV